MIWVAIVFLLSTSAVYGITLDRRMLNSPEVSPFFKYPFMVRIDQNEELFHYGGTLYQNNFVITAGHCITSKTGLGFHTHRHGQFSDKKSEPFKAKAIPSLYNRSSFKLRPYNFSILYGNLDLAVVKLYIVPFNFQTKIFLDKMAV